MTMKTVHDLSAAQPTVNPHQYHPTKRAETAAIESALHVATHLRAGPLPENATRVVAIVGEPMRFAVALESVSARFDLIRSPAEPTAEGDDLIAKTKRAIQANNPVLTSGVLIPNRPGLYRILITISGGWSRTVDVAAVPAQLLDRISAASAIGNDRRDALMAIVRDPKCTPESIARALEQRDPMTALEAGGFHDKQVRTQSYGAGIGA